MLYEIDHFQLERGSKIGKDAEATQGILPNPPPHPCPRDGPHIWRPPTRVMILTNHGGAMIRDSGYMKDVNGFVRASQLSLVGFPSSQLFHNYRWIMRLGGRSAFRLEDLLLASKKKKKKKKKKKEYCFKWITTPLITPRTSIVMRTRREVRRLHSAKNIQHSVSI